MTAPTGSVTFDKTSYAPGETITATVSYQDADTKTGTAKFDLTDSQGNKTPATATFSVADPVSVASDPTNDRAWTKLANSDNGSSVKFTATA